MTHDPADKSPTLDDSAFGYLPREQAREQDTWEWINSLIPIAGWAAVVIVFAIFLALAATAMPTDFWARAVAAISL